MTTELKTIPELRASAKVLRNKCIKIEVPPEFAEFRNFVALDLIPHQEQTLEVMEDMDEALTEYIDRETGFLQPELAAQLLGVFALARDVVEEVAPFVENSDDDLAKHRIASKVSLLMQGIELSIDEIKQITAEPDDEEGEDEGDEEEDEPDGEEEKPETDVMDKVANDEGATE